MARKVFFGSLGISVAVMLAAGCYDSREGVGSAQGALHGAGSTPDTSFPSVVMIDPGGFCSGTLLSDSTALMAAHCVAQVASHCRTEGAELSSNGGAYGGPDDVRLSVSGTSGPSDALPPNGETYRIDRIVAHPRSFFNVKACSSLAPNNCSTVTANNVVTGYDLALVHFAVAAGQHPPSYYMSSFRPVITSVTDTNSSPTGTRHVNLDLTTKIIPSTNAWVMGWGNDDNAGGGIRLGATDQFVNTGASFGQNCDGIYTCSGALNPSATCTDFYGFHTNSFADRAFHLKRWGSSGSATGGALGSGDSGGPVFIHAGAGFGDVNDAALIGTPGGPYFQIGVNSGGSGCDPGDGVAIGGAQCDMWFAPTWAPDTGAFIEKTLTAWATDLDQDGTLNSADNCPALANSPQDNANIIAEQALSDTPAGDACDVNAATRGLPGVEWKSPVNATCTNIVLNGNQTFTISSGGSCPVVYNTGITMRGNIGNATGTAVNATGQSVPSFCACAAANSSASAGCGSSPYFCGVAQDVLEPYLNTPSSGWKTITQRDASDHLYNWVSLTHQDPSDSQILFGLWDSTKDVTTNWNYMLDMSAFGASGTTLLGQVWTHLPPTYFSPGAGETQPAQDRPSHYIDFQASQHNGYTFSSAPPLVNLYVPIWVKVISGPDVPYLLPGMESSGAVDVVAETQGGVQWMNGRFDSTALNALTSVVAHTSDWIVADEFVAGDGANSSSAVRAITTWSNDTSIRGGFRQPYQVLTATTTANANSSFAPAARAYSASTGKLYALKNATGWRLYAFDVAGALAGSPSSTNVAITGITPSTPRAMAYDASSGNLFVVDSLSVAGGTGLRLSRLTTGGVAKELWRTTGVATVPAVYLSVSTTGEVVLGLVQSAFNLWETVVLDKQGQPWSSTAGSGLLLARPVANEAGVSIGRASGAAGTAQPTLLIARSSMTNGLRGATWLKAHVDATTTGPLGYPAGDCP